MSLRSTISGRIRSLLRARGREIVPYDRAHFPDLYRRQLFADHGITLVLDVGANSGQTGHELREEGYSGRIVSFEPLSGPFALLKKAADADGNWEARHTAVGDSDGTAQINVSGTSWSSSFLPMDDRHVSMVPASAYVSTETVNLTRLDSVFDSIVRPGDRVYLKADTQGFEMNVLLGARASLPRIDAVQLELSLASLYTGQPKYYELMRHLDESGFDMVKLDGGFMEPATGHYLQADAIFVRRSGK